MPRRGSSRGREGTRPPPGRQGSRRAVHKHEGLVEVVPVALTHERGSDGVQGEVQRLQKPMNRKPAAAQTACTVRERDAWSAIRRNGEVAAVNHPTETRGPSMVELGREGHARAERGRRQRDSGDPERGLGACRAARRGGKGDRHWWRHQQ